LDPLGDFPESLCSPVPVQVEVVMRVEEFESEVQAGNRFRFGENWRSFLSRLDDERVRESARCLAEMLETERLQGMSFLDLGCGSGLSSLAAMRLGAEKVLSMDYDPQSVGCALELKRKHLPGEERWRIETGNALDEKYLQTLGGWDIVYSWGVLHHTGAMWRALGNVVGLVREGGLLFISIYNDAGNRSRCWRRIKSLYNRSRPARWLLVPVFFSRFILMGFLSDLFHLKNPLSRYREYKKRRGMSVFHDWLDWLGGYPFEVATPEAIFDFFRERGFTLRRLRTCEGDGCNQFVFRKG
jgi:2-polyprenyl-3-methyl-5-hydroxy-6-metoxy-1,4-benzoquinol methylase